MMNTLQKLVCTVFRNCFKNVLNRPNMYFKFIHNFLLNQQNYHQISPNTKTSLMRAPRLSLASITSQKTQTYATRDSQPSTQIGYYVPYQNQKRFTRKNNNSSVDKCRNRNNLDNEQDSNLSIVQKVLSPKISKQKSMILLKGKNDLNVTNKSMNKTEVNISKTSSFKLLRTRQNTNKAFQSSLRISQQKNTERLSGISIDSRSNRCARSNNIAVLRTQLQLKEKQLMALEDQRRKFRNKLEEMKRKEYLLQQKVNQCEIKQKQNQLNFEENIHDLEKRLEHIMSNNRELQLENQKIKKELFQLSKDKIIVQKQLSMFIDKKVPKNIKQLQSCRQISLQNSLQQLKLQLNMNKSDLQRSMQQAITKLRHENMGLTNQLRNIGIVNRLLQKKSCDSQRYLSAYTIIKSQYKNIRKENKDLQQQCELLRLENVRIKKDLKKTNVVMIGNKQVNLNSFLSGKSIKNLEVQNQGSDNESLNLSLSTCSR